MTGEARERGLRSSAVRRAACERIIAGQTQERFYDESFEARTRRKARELDIVHGLAEVRLAAEALLGALATDATD